MKKWIRNWLFKDELAELKVLRDNQRKIARLLSVFFGSDIIINVNL